MRKFSDIGPEANSSLNGFPDLARVRLVAVQKVEHTSPWFIRGTEGMAGFYAVLKGRCRLRFHQSEMDLALEAGDIAVLPRGKSHWLQSSPRSSDYALCDVLGTTILVRGCFVWNEDTVSRFLPKLPPVTCFKNEDGCFASWVRDIVQVINDKSASDRPKARVLADYFARAILEQSIRVRLQEKCM
jgi:hypothetical protein